mgnify:FL=1
MKSWESFGYETTKPCDVCGTEGNNRTEPVYYYTVCKEHYHLTPIEVSIAITEREEGK